MLGTLFASFRPTTADGSKAREQNTKLKVQSTASLAFKLVGNGSTRVLLSRRFDD